MLQLPLAVVALTPAPSLSAEGPPRAGMRTVNAPDAPAPSGGYAQAVEVRNPRRILYVSGQIPVTPQGDAPTQFEAQCRLVWKNLEAQLRAAGMSLDNLVKVTTYLGDRRHAATNSRIRREVMEERSPALTVIITGIYDESWLLEIEAIAAD
jgi:enamine deaminase RidA (YjgF/YER057c/UK114 family)